ncbi:MAG: GNAT family N-acetyltransferase [Anaerolineaceae bacterium]|nr:GNAT family N-acetyltransferase [Anaerolineaceae bacterium]
MDDLKIVQFEGEAEAGFIRARLDEFNFRLVPADDHQTLNLLVRRGEVIVAGLLADTYWGWLYISILWVGEEIRGQGLGSRLLIAAEEMARQRGCSNAHLETHDFQALEFYKRHNYVVFGQLEDLPLGHTKYYLQKRFANKL